MNVLDPRYDYARRYIKTGMQRDPLDTEWKVAGALLGHFAARRLAEELALHVRFDSPTYLYVFRREPFDAKTRMVLR